MVWVRCSNEDCWCQMVTRFDEPEEAIEAWNKRDDKSVSFPVVPGDCLFAAINGNVVKYKVNEIRVFGKNLRYFICINATDQFKANVYGYDRKMEIIPEQIGKRFFINPDEAAKTVLRRNENVYLKPCPFCGNEDVKAGGWPVEYVSCKCGAKGPDYSSKALAILAWNRRVADERR